MLVACSGLVPADCTCYRCWYMGRYIKCLICIYRCEYTVLVLVIQLYVMGLAQSFLIVIVNMEYYIIVFIVRDSVFQTWIVSAELNSCSLFAVHGEFDWRIGRSLTVSSQLQYRSST